MLLLLACCCSCADLAPTALKRFLCTMVSRGLLFVVVVASVAACVTAGTTPEGRDFLAANSGEEGWTTLASGLQVRSDSFGSVGPFFVEHLVVL